MFEVMYSKKSENFSCGIGIYFEFDSTFFRQASEYNKVMSSLRTLDFTPSAIDSIWAMTAAILHLGNVDFFLDENDTAGIRNMDVVDKVL